MKSPYESKKIPYIIGYIPRRKPKSPYEPRGLIKILKPTK